MTMHPFFAGSLEERIFQRQLVKRKALATAIGSEDAAADGALTAGALATASADPRGAALAQARQVFSHRRVPYV